MDVSLQSIRSDSADEMTLRGTDSSSHILQICFERWRLEWKAPCPDVRFMIVDLDGTCLGQHGDSADFALPFQHSAQDVLEAASGTEPLTSRTGSEKLQFDAEPLLLPNGSCMAYLGIEAKGLPDGLCPLLLKNAGLTLVLLYLAEVHARSSRFILQELKRSEREAEKRDKLFEVVQRLHSMIGVNDVLSEVYESIRSYYKTVEIDFFLSQDYNHTNVHVKPLRFINGKDDICTCAFMEGRLIHHQADMETQVAAPLSGKQGVYGVLHLYARNLSLDPGDIQFISLVSTTAGVAFENAKLYEQSNLLISELRMINEIAKQLNQSLKLSDIFNFACAELIHIFNADYCCIFQVDKKNKVMIAQASNLLSMYQQYFSLDSGFSGIVYGTGEPLIISDYLKNPIAQSKFMEATGSRSLIASPIFTDGEIEGTILVSHGLANYFSYENFKLLQVLAVHIGLAISNASLHAEVRRMVVTDNLTGLFTRRYLDDQIAVMQNKDSCGSLIVVDIDNFKKVNDTFGHQVGDRILIQVSSIVRNCIRDSDIAARWGGEELAIYLPEVPIEHAVRVSERIRTRVYEETDPQVTVSCGISDWNREDEKISVETLFYKSDMALYKAKHSGKNQIKIG